MLALLRPGQLSRRRSTAADTHYLMVSEDVALREAVRAASGDVPELGCGFGRLCDQGRQLQAELRRVVALGGDRHPHGAHVSREHPASSGCAGRPALRLNEQYG